MASIKWHSIVLTLQTHIQAMLSSNLSQVTGYPERCFPSAHFPPGKRQGGATVRATHTESYITTASI
jgi:hypothetical protein